MSEFSLIHRYFKRPTRHTDLAGGDDAALMSPRAGMQLVVSIDMLVSGVHFFADTDAFGLGWKAAAVNISDIAAMGAEPRWIVLAGAFPEIDEAWIKDLADGFTACCDANHVDWSGGDTTRGPLNLCATVFGEVPQGTAITRSGAQAGDDIWVSGQPGLAALGLAHLQGELVLHEDWRDRCLARLQRPLPRVALGMALRGMASAMLDVSDGLAGDLAHILKASACGAVLEDAALPLADCLAACQDAARARQALLCGGDDYELLFTAAPAHREALAALDEELGLPLHRIGHINTQVGALQLVQEDGSEIAFKASSFDHFGQT